MFPRSPTDAPTTREFCHPVTWFRQQFMLRLSIYIYSHVLWWQGNSASDICAVLGYYSAHSGNSLPTFRDNLSIPSSMVRNLCSWKYWPLMMGPIGCPVTSVRNYHYTLRNIAEKHRSALHRRGSLKSRTVQVFWKKWIVIYGLVSCGSG